MSKQFCCLKSCNNRSTIVNGVLRMPPGISFHKFPSDRKLYEQWKTALNLTADPVRSNPHICSDHFDVSDFREGSQTRRLTKFAVPSLQVENTSLPSGDQQVSIFSKQESLFMKIPCNSNSSVNEGPVATDVEAPEAVASTIEFEEDIDMRTPEVFQQQRELPETTKSATVNGLSLSQCRVCSLESENNISLFDAYGALDTIGQHLFKLLEVNLCPGDGFPTRICIPCAAKLRICTTLQDAALQMQRTLDTMLATSGECRSISQCRVCSSDSPMNESLFDAHGAVSTIGRCLFNLIHINLCPGDGLPTRICMPCSAQLKMCNVFQESALEMHDKYERVLAIQ